MGHPDLVAADAIPVQVADHDRKLRRVRGIHAQHDGLGVRLLGRPVLGEVAPQHRDVPGDPSGQEQPAPPGQQQHRRCDGERRAPTVRCWSAVGQARTAATMNRDAQRESGGHGMVLPSVCAERNGNCRQRKCSGAGECDDSPGVVTRGRFCRCGNGFACRLRRSVQRHAGDVPGERGHRIDTAGADHVRRRTGRALRRRGQSVHHLTRVQIGKLCCAPSRRNAGHVRRGVAGAVQRDQLVLIGGHGIGESTAGRVAHRRDVLSRRGDADPRAAMVNPEGWPVAFSDPTDST